MADTPAWKVKEMTWVTPDKIQALRTAVASEMHGWPERDDEATYRRFLLAREGDVEKASKMCRAYLDWRRGHTPDFPRTFPFESIRDEVATGKAFFHPTDKCGRPCAVVLARLHYKSKVAGASERFIVYALDQLVAKMKDGVQHFVGVFDLKGFGYSNIDMGATKALIRILDVVFAERLANAYVINESKMFWTLWKMVSPLINERTKSKIHFLGKSRDKLIEDFGADNLWTEFGGNWHFSFTPDNLAPEPGTNAGMSTDESKVSEADNKAAETPASSLSASKLKPTGDSAGAKRRANWFSSEPAAAPAPSTRPDE